MEELKASLQNELSHVRVVYFDANDNWYLHKNSNIVREMTKDEILSQVEESPEGGESPEQGTGKRKKK